MLVDLLKCDRKEKLEKKEKFRLQLKLNLRVPQVGIFLFKQNQTIADQILKKVLIRPEAEFKEFGPRFKFKRRLKYGWFHLKSYLMFQD